MNNLNDNITFFLEEKIEDSQNTNDNEIQKMLNEFEEDDFEEYMPTNNDYSNNDYSNNDLMYFSDKKFYGDDELYYNQEYTVKYLLRICEYYGIDKDIKSSKCKKQDIISTIIFFESLPENFEIVQKRHKMWAYILELTNDPKMKKYIIWK
jgi:tRNA(Ile)-lysidine synthase TilS/MesJ